MFISFFLSLRQVGLSVGIKEFLTFLSALKQRVIDYDVEEFYFLAQSVFVKREEDLDTFDKIFSAYFSGMEQIPDDLFQELPEEWLKKEFENLLSPEQMEKIKSYGDLDELMKRLKDLLDEQKERHAGGNKWIGTGGTSPFGAYGYNPNGIRIGQDESRHRKAAKVWDKRQFADLRSDVELNTRNLKMSLRYLRDFTREGRKTEFDLPTTISKTSKNAGILDVQMRAPEKNNVKVLLLFDIGGSMDDFIHTCEQFFSAAKYEFKHLEFFYFHNCPYDFLWKENVRRWNDRVPTYEVFNTFNSDYHLIIVGDASMSPYEILYKGGANEYMNAETGATWIKRITERFPKSVWLNPVPENEWQYTESIGIIQQLMYDKMFHLSPGGIKDAIQSLHKKGKASAPSI
ncbi:MAG: VWA domain-containing protein [Cyclobacteriaceae bacterium]|nr:VWA domain-containing protein [Cyclobacteriaceae bacterium]MCH8517327.1 VWA domain-containing protein [Cyclobacteriaceae bacterium]